MLFWWKYCRFLAKQSFRELKEFGDFSVRDSCQKGVFNFSICSLKIPGCCKVTIHLQRCNMVMRSQLFLPIVWLPYSLNTETTVKQLKIYGEFSLGWGSVCFRSDPQSCERLSNRLLPINIGILFPLEIFLYACSC